MSALFRTPISRISLIVPRGCARGLSTAPSYHVLDDKVSLDTLTSSNPRVLAYFTATWCGPCRAIAPKFSSLADANKGVKFVKIDIDDNEQAAQKVSFLEDLILIRTHFFMCALFCLAMVYEVVLHLSTLHLSLYVSRLSVCYLCRTL